MTETSTGTRCHHRDFKTQADTQQIRQGYYSIDEKGLLTRKVVDGGHKFCTIYLPAVLVLQVLHAAHDDLGHN